jgi:hypothetical protein
VECSDRDEFLVVFLIVVNFLGVFRDLIRSWRTVYSGDVRER